MESEGVFGMGKWEEAFEAGRGRCLGEGVEEGEGSEDVEMGEEEEDDHEGGKGEGGLMLAVRRTMERKVERDGRWKKGAA